MHSTERRGTLTGMLLNAVIVGAFTALSADAATIAVGLGVLLLVGMTVSTTVAAVTRAAQGTCLPGARRLRRQWSRSPIDLLDPGLAGNPQPRAPGNTAPEVLVRVPAA